MIPQRIARQHIANEWVNHGFEILLAHALLGDLPELDNDFQGRSIQIPIVEEMAWHPLRELNPGNIPEIPRFSLDHTEIHNINVISRLSRLNSLNPRCAEDYLRRCLTRERFAMVSRIKETLEYDRYLSPNIPVPHNVFALSGYLQLIGRLPEVAMTNARRCYSVSLKFKTPTISPSNLCRSCGRKVPLTDGLCEPCQKVEVLMKDCFDENIDLSTHAGQTYEGGILEGRD